jgi:hypothetical protein
MKALAPASDAVSGVIIPLCAVLSVVPTFLLVVLADGTVFCPLPAGVAVAPGEGVGVGLPLCGVGVTLVPPGAIASEVAVASAAGAPPDALVGTGVGTGVGALVGCFVGAFVGTGVGVGTRVGVGVGVFVGVGVVPSVAEGVTSLAIVCTRPLAWAVVSSATTPSTENNSSARLIAMTRKVHCVILIDFLFTVIKPPNTMILF